MWVISLSFTSSYFSLSWSWQDEKSVEITESVITYSRFFFFNLFILGFHYSCPSLQYNMTTYKNKPINLALTVNKSELCYNRIINI